jgi:hypothetical protein
MIAGTLRMGDTHTQHFFESIEAAIVVQQRVIVRRRMKTVDRLSASATLYSSAMISTGPAVLAMIRAGAA